MKRTILVFALAALASGLAFPASAVFKAPEHKCEEFLKSCLTKVERAKLMDSEASASSDLSADACRRAHDFAKANGSWPDTPTQLGGVCKP